MAIEIATRTEVIDELAKALLVTPAANEALRRALAADVIRHHIGQQGVSATLSITNRLRQACNPILGASDSAADRLTTTAAADRFYRDSVQSLRRLRDIQQQTIDGKKLYALAPLRLVHLGSDAKIALVMGGSSTAQSSAILGAPIRAYGFARYVERGKLPQAVRVDEGRWQNAHDWLGCKDRSLQQFTDGMTDPDRHVWTLGSPLGAGNVEILIPEARHGRWFRLASMRECPIGIHLCRATLDAPEYPSAPKLHFIAILRRDESDIIAIARHAIVSPNDGNRLTYGLERRHDNGIKVQATLTAEEVLLPLRRQLPLPERRIMELGIRSGGETHDSDVRFSIALIPVLSLILGSLGIKLEVGADAG